MWIVRLALNRPYTFIVLALLFLVATPLVLIKTPTDIFPNIDIPVISVIWDYTGLSADEMSTRISGNYERVLTTTVNDIEHIESQTFRGRAVVKIFFHPTVKIDMALAQVTAVSQTMLRNLPTGTQPPLIITYNASSVPVVQLGMSSKSLSEQEINDLAMNSIRTQLVTIPGAGVPYPYGGKMRQVMVDIDLDKLRSRGLSPADVVNAISAENLILPGGTAKIGATEYDVAINGSTQTVEELNALPIKTIDGVVIYVGDVAHVRDGFQDQTNIVRQDGTRAVLLSVIKTGSTSTLAIVDGVLGMLPKLLAQVPPELTVKALSDQSIFVRSAISGVLREAVIAACLTAMMILLFLADWKATLIIAVSIPLSIICSICALSALGHSINLMTLGGLALAVGILVDDATVTIENIDSHLEKGAELRQAILDGAHQIAVPAFVSTLCICIVFVPMFLLSGVAKYLFVPLAEAVVFAMIASYFWSRTLVPTLAMYLLKRHEHGSHARPSGIKAPFVRIQHGFERGFEKFKAQYRRALSGALHHRGFFAAAFLMVCLGSLVLVPFLGQDFFPDVDAGQIRMHMRVKTGTRIEETARIADEVEKKVREIIPASQVDSVLDNIGVPYSGINTSYSNNGTFGSGDAEILISLKRGHSPTAGYVKEMRSQLPKFFPGVSFFFQPADIVSQILNFGLPSPIDVQIVGSDMAKNFEIASQLQARMREIPGIADVHIQQALDQPSLKLNVDRSKSTELGLTHADVANSVLVALNGSGQTTPTFWLSPKNGIVYSLQSKVPQYHIESLQDLQNLPVVHANSSTNGTPQLLSNLATVSRSAGAGVVSHYNARPTVDVYASNQGRDLGGVAADVRKLVSEAEKNLPRGTTIVLRGQVQTMQSSFVGLGIGVLGAIVLVYALIVVNFQSWTDPFIIITALPGALAGIVWMLFLTGTTISVPALMGTIMCVGVATANSVLVVSFAKEAFEDSGDALDAALQAGVTRLRPVLMTALAMILGMIPMALGLGEGGEQNAPLARAVIGGLLFATVATLLFVPVVFSLLRHEKPDEEISPTDHPLPEPAKTA